MGLRYIQLMSLKYIRDIFEYDISKIEKKVIDNVFTYNCFNKNGNLIVSYVLIGINIRFNIKTI